MESRSYRASNLTRVFEFSVFSMEGRRVRRDKAKKGEKKERKRSDSKVGRSARFRRARRAGHSSILASRADGLSLPLPLRPSSSSSFSSGKLSALLFPLSPSLEARGRSRRRRGFCSRFPLVSRVHRHQQPSLNDSRQL